MEYASSILRDLIRVCNRDTLEKELGEYALILAVANDSGFCYNTSALWNKTPTGMTLLAEICDVYISGVEKEVSSDDDEVKVEAKENPSDDDDEIKGEAKFNEACHSIAN